MRGAKAGLVLGMAAMVVGAGPAARAATITVTSLADNLTTDGLVTLREALVAANTDTSVDGSTAGSGPDEIVFGTPPGTIVLGGTPLPAVTGGLTLRGPGAGRLAISGADASRVLEIADGASVTLLGVTIRNGRVSPGDGGGIRNAGLLLVQDSVFTANAAMGNGGAIWNGGTLIVTGTTLSQNTALNGGGIRNDSVLLVETSTFSQNATGGIAPSTGGGGGISSVASASVQSSAFLSNFAANGGGIQANGELGVLNTTLAGNEALNNGGGISASASTTALDITACTITGNRADINDDALGSGGGLSASDGVTLLQATIVAGNEQGAGTAQDVAGTLLPDSADNLVGVDTGLGGISHGSNGNQVGTAASPLDPLLGAPQNNGGSTPTQAPLSGSPALDAAGTVPCPTLDQRGVPRPLDGDAVPGAVCDIGAYEAFVVATESLSFYALPPCRLVDTRLPTGPAGGPALDASQTRFFEILGSCGIPGDARAVVLNATVVNPSAPGNLRLYPMGTALPLASTLNFAAARVRANIALVPVGAAGSIAVRLDAAGGAGTAHLVLDTSGYLR